MKLTARFVYEPNPDLFDMRVHRAMFGDDVYWQLEAKYDDVPNEVALTVIRHMANGFDFRVNIFDYGGYIDSYVSMRPFDDEHVLYLNTNTNTILLFNKKQQEKLARAANEAVMLIDYDSKIVKYGKTFCEMIFAACTYTVGALGMLLGCLLASIPYAIISVIQLGSMMKVAYEAKKLHRTRQP